MGDGVFPCGWILAKKTGEDRLYYGAADTCIGLATADLQELVDFVRSGPKPPKSSF